MTVDYRHRAPDGAPRTERGLDRLVNFSDATVAIAITLLVLPLVDVATEVGPKPLGTVLHENTGPLVSFFISFIVIGRFWTVHHRIFEYVHSYSKPLVWANFVWLLSIVFLPFSANVLGRSSGAPAISALYIGTLIVTSASAGVIDWIIKRDPALADADAVTTLSIVPAVIFSALLSIALVVAVAWPVINLWALLLLWLAGPISRGWAAWVERRGSRQR